MDKKKRYIKEEVGSSGLMLGEAKHLLLDVDGRARGGVRGMAGRAKPRVERRRLIQKRKILALTKLIQNRKALHPQSQQQQQH